MDKPFSLYIIDASGTCLFAYNFRGDVKPIDSILFSGFLSAMIHFSKQFDAQMTSEGAVDQFSILSTISFNTNFEIIIEQAMTLIAAMFIEKRSNLSEMKTFLKQVLYSFYNSFSEILEHWDRDVSHFEPFTNELEQIFLKGQIYTYQIPKIIKEIPPSLTSTIFPLEPHIDGLRSIREIADLTNLPLEEIKQIIAKLWWNDCVELSQSVTLNDIFEPHKELFYLIRTAPPTSQGKVKISLDPIHFKVLQKINGFMSIYEIDRELEDVPAEDIQKIISYYLTKGLYLRKLKLFPQILQIDAQYKTQISSDMLALLFTLENICDGELSLENISQKIRVPISVIKSVLNQIGAAVTYRKEYEF